MSERANALGLPGESEEYRRSRGSLLEAEIELRRQIEAVAAQLRTLPLGGEVPTDYSFDESAPATDDSKSIRLSELFAPDKDTLLLYSFMFIPDNGMPLGVACPSCTSIIDALDGAAPHIAQRINLAVVAKAPIAQFREHARRRGWRNVRLLSSAETTYNRDYHAESPDDGAQNPVATVFLRRDGRIHHFWSSELFFAERDPGMDPRHVDFMWPLWSVFDLTPEGRGTDWRPQLDYP
jgi:predicted dithiol-disulfide oxidoreductase (DUF899 family)